MKTSSTSVVLPCTPKAFWNADESYLNALYLEELQYPAFSVIEIDTAKGQRRFEAKRRSEAGHAAKRGVAMECLQDPMPDSSD